MYKTEMSVRMPICLSVCPSCLEEGGWEAAEGDGEGGQEGEGQWGGGISVMEWQGGHTFPEQCRVTQLVIYNYVHTYDY